MGGVCCCLRWESFDEYITYPNGSFCQRCLCLRCFIRCFFHMYAALFDRAETRDLPPHQVISSPSSGLITRTSNSSPLDTFRPPPRPLPYDADSRYIRLQRDGLVSRRDKCSLSHLHGSEPDPLRPAMGEDEGETIPFLSGEGPVKEPGQYAVSESKDLRKVESMSSVMDDEDVCPTCLDVYTQENPKINTHCGHHFHLACILEWMERSDHCPICYKEMEINEEDL